MEEKEITDAGFDNQVTKFFNIILGENPPKGRLNICVKTRNKGLRTSSFNCSDKTAIIDGIKRSREEGDLYYETCFQPELPENNKRGKAVDKDSTPGIWMDLDVAGPGHASDAYPATKEEALRFILDFTPTLVIDTGGGYQSYWLFHDLLIFDNEKERDKAAKLVESFQRYIINKGIEKGWRFDFTGDLARLMRVPGTYNCKNNEKREVRIVHFDNDRRYSPEDFSFLRDNKKEPENLPAIQASSSANDVYPPSKAEGIIDHCSFIKHCVEDAETLTEPEWFIFNSIIAHCENGPELCHKYSSPYPGYSFQETQIKIENVLKKGPATCAKIQLDPNAGRYCSHCPFQSHVKSPIRLGHSSESAQLMIKGVKILVGAYDDPGLPFEKENIHTLIILKQRQPDTYTRIRSVLAKMNISVTALETATQNYVFDGEEDSNGIEFSPYIIRKNCMLFVKETQFGKKLIPISNFAASIKEQVFKDNGLCTVILYKIQGVLNDGTVLPDVEVPADEFRNTTWVAKNYGAKAIISAGQSSPDHLRAAIQVLSSDIKERSVFAHTGWRNIGGEWVFLSSSGALGKNGLDMNTEVILEGKLKYYSIKDLPANLSIQEAVSASLKMLEVAPENISMPMLCGTYRAPLEEMLMNDFTIYFVGGTGTLKSALTAIMIGHFGEEFHGKNLPAEWIATGNALEKMAFLAKDTIFIVDDYFPGNNQHEASKINATADRIIRGQGNKSGRARMNADGSLRNTYISRSLIVTSGEDIARGQSLRARMYIIEIVAGDVNLEVLSDLQKKASEGILVGAMAAYLKWLAPQIDELKVTLPKRKNELRDEVMKQTSGHMRAPDTIAGLLLGLEVFLTFAMEIGVYNETQALDLWTRAIKALIDSDKMHQEVLEAEDPVKRFLNLLLTSFLTGTVHLDAKAGGAPTVNPVKWGWKVTTSPLGNSETPLGKLIGWIDGINLYLDADASFAAVQGIAVKQGSPITMTPITVRKRLEERGILIKSSDGKLIKMMTLDGSKRKVMHLLTTKVCEEEQSVTVSDDFIDAGNIGSFAMFGDIPLS
jgi:hypothetical protein